MMASGCHYTRHFDSIKSCRVMGCLKIGSLRQGRVQHELVLLVDRSERISVRNRAETRASIAQGLERGSQGARDRVVTEH